MADRVGYRRYRPTGVSWKKAGEAEVDPVLEPSIYDSRPPGWIRVRRQDHRQSQARPQQKHRHR
jgi:hypothetical protein